MSIRFADRGQERELMAWIIRKFPEGRIPSEQAQYLVQHPEELPDLLLGMIASRTISSAEQLQAVVSDWQKLFGHLRILDPNFNESSFPLEPEDKLRPVIRKQFSDTATGHERFRWAESQGLGLALPRATGLGLKDPQLKTQVVVGGGLWKHRSGNVYVPVFGPGGGRPYVSLGDLGYDFSPGCVWLFSRKPGT